ncbi:MAG: hypothetical protein MI923_09045 [Phycisphaerales bacterium]|nr:hypothetical protein [Phycisphaerales bacterium]
MWASFFRKAAITAASGWPVIFQVGLVWSVIGRAISFLLGGGAAQQPKFRGSERWRRSTRSDDREAAD